jgi:hypothetical protein
MRGNRNSRPVRAALGVFQNSHPNELDGFPTNFDVRPGSSAGGTLEAVRG